MFNIFRRKEMDNIRDKIEFAKFAKGAPLSKFADYMLGFDILQSLYTNKHHEKSKVFVEGDDLALVNQYLCKLLNIEINEYMTLEEVINVSTSEKQLYTFIFKEDLMYTPQLYQLFRVFFDKHEYIFTTCIEYGSHAQKHNGWKVLVNQGMNAHPPYRPWYATYGEGFGKLEGKYDDIQTCSKVVDDKFIKQYEKNLKELYKLLKKNENKEQETVEQGSK